MTSTEARKRGRASALVAVLSLPLTLLAGTPDEAWATHPTAVQGTLTEEGVQCPALRGDDGKLYTLSGDLRGHDIGDHVLVVGPVAHANFCQQGTTIQVLLIEPAP